MTKGPDAFRTISEVAEELNVPQHVLRFWETRFSQIRPLKRSGGRRFYRPDDVALLRGIRHLLYGEGYTIRGVQRILKEQGIGRVQRTAPDADTAGDLPAAPREGLETDDFAPDDGFHDTDGLDRAEEADSVDDFDPAPLSAREDGFPEDLTGDPASDLSGDLAGDFPGDQAGDLASGPAGDAARDDGLLRDAPVPLPPAYDSRDPDPSGIAAHAGDHDGWSPAEGQGDGQGDGDAGDYVSSVPHNPATQTIESVMSRYAPGPLSGRAGAARAEGAARADAMEDRVIQSRYRLTTDTREHLQAALDEIRECRRLLNSALSRLQD